MSFVLRFAVLVFVILCFSFLPFLKMVGWASLGLEQERRQIFTLPGRSGGAGTYHLFGSAMYVILHVVN